MIRAVVRARILEGERLSFEEFKALHGPAAPRHDEAHVQAMLR